MNPIRVFILLNIPDYLILHYSMYITLDEYNSDDEEDNIVDESSDYDNINCSNNQIYIKNAAIFDKTMKSSESITNKLVLLASIQKRVNINDIIYYCINNKKNSYLSITYITHSKKYIVKYIDIDNKVNIITRKKLVFGDICG
jgi:hypothetical protein